MLVFIKKGYYAAFLCCDNSSESANFKERFGDHSRISEQFDVTEYWDWSRHPNTLDSREVALRLSIVEKNWEHFWKNWIQNLARKWIKTYFRKVLREGEHLIEGSILEFRVGDMGQPKIIATLKLCK